VGGEQAGGVQVPRPRSICIYREAEKEESAKSLRMKELERQEVDKEAVVSQITEEWNMGRRDSSTLSHVLAEH
jgi:hypothetical protein